MTIALLVSAPALAAEEPSAPPFSEKLDSFVNHCASAERDEADTGPADALAESMVFARLAGLAPSDLGSLKVTDDETDGTKLVRGSAPPNVLIDRTASGTGLLGITNWSLSDANFLEFDLIDYCGVSFVTDVAEVMDILTIQIDGLREAGGRPGTGSPREGAAYRAFAATPAFPSRILLSEDTLPDGRRLISIETMTERD